MNRLVVIAFVVVAVALLVASCIEPTPTVSPLPTPTYPPSPLAATDRGEIEPLEITINGGEPMDFTEMLAIAVFLSIVANRLIEALIAPLFDKYNLDKFWLQYVSWVVGAVLVGLSGVNLFAAYLPSAAVGLVLTAIVCGGGANFINDLFDDVL